MAHDYKPRFIKPEQSAELVNLYHLARVALAGSKCPCDRPHPPCRWARMIWASNAFCKEHPEGEAQVAIYKDLDGLLS